MDPLTAALILGGAGAGANVYGNLEAQRESKRARDLAEYWRGEQEKTLRTLNPEDLEALDTSYLDYLMPSLAPGTTYPRGFERDIKLDIF